MIFGKKNFLLSVVLIFSVSINAFGQCDPNGQGFDRCMTTPTPTPAAAQQAPENYDDMTAGYITDTKFSACKGSASAAEVSCKSIQMTPQVTAAVNSIAQAGATGDIKKICEASKKLNIIAGSANIGFATTCLTTSNSCKSSCKAAASNENTNYNNCINNARNKCLNSLNPSCSSFEMQACAKHRENAAEASQLGSSCSGLTTVAGQGFMQAMQNYVGYQQSKTCETAVAAETCETMDDLRNKPVCPPIMCDPISGKYRNKGLSECAQYIADVDCSLSQYMYTEPKCICDRNPQDPMCPTAEPAVAAIPAEQMLGEAGSSMDGGFADADLLNQIPGDTAEAFGSKNPNGGGAGGQMQPGGAFSPGGGFSGNPTAGKGTNKGSLNTDILQGPAGGGGYSAGGTGSYPFGTGSSGDKNGMNLRDFLPGGKRGLAGKSDLEKNGVSDMNGPSNFEKVSRQVNRLRETKQTIETK